MDRAGLDAGLRFVPFVEGDDLDLSGAAESRQGMPRGAAPRTTSARR